MVIASPAFPWLGEILVIYCDFEEFAGLSSPHPIKNDKTKIIKTKIL